MGNSKSKETEAEKAERERQQAKAHRVFITKTYLTLLLQLLFATTVSVFFFYSEDAQEWTRKNEWLTWVAIVSFAVTFFTLICFRGWSRNFPWNYLIILLLTLKGSFIEALACVNYKPRLVGISAGITLAVVVVVMILAYFVKYDFTQWDSIIKKVLLLFVGLGLCIFVCYLYNISLVYVKMFYIIFSTFFLIIYLGILTQQIQTGDKSNFNVGNHCFAALRLYTQLVVLFIEIVQFMGKYTPLKEDSILEREE